MASVGRFIYLVQKVEAAYPEWTTDRLVTNLRRAAGYDTSLFQQLLGTQPGVAILPKGNLKQQDIDEISGSMSHQANGNQEIGISLDDSTGRNVTMGHVIVGISAGIHHPPPVIYVDIDPIKQIPDITLNKQRLGLDPLYATTITGDLGQTSVQPYTLCSQTACTFGGVGSEATSAELHGDIDGFMLGYWLSTTPAGQNYRSIMVQNNNGAKVSTMLEEYYRTRTDRPIGMTAGSGYSLEAIRRFFNFKPTFKTLKIDFAAQTIAFNGFYASKVMGKIPDPVQSATAVIDFENWCNRGGI